MKFARFYEAPVARPWSKHSGQQAYDDTREPMESYPTRGISMFKHAAEWMESFGKDGLGTYATMAAAKELGPDTR